MSSVSSRSPLQSLHKLTSLATPLLLAAVCVSSCGGDAGAGDDAERGGTGSSSGGNGRGGVAAGGSTPSSTAGGGAASPTPAGGSAASGGSAGSGSGAQSAGGAAPASSGGTSSEAGAVSAGAGGSTGGGTVGGEGQGGSAGSAGSLSPGGAGGTGAGGSAGTGNQGGTAGAAPSYLPCPTNGDPCRVMPLGDSITEGTTFGGGYRVELFHQALLSSKKITFVGSWARASAGFPAPDKVDGVAFPKDHEGHSGYNIDETNGGWGLYPKYTKAIPTYKPNIILLMIGTNDINNGVDIANAPTRLGHLLDVLTSENPAALIVVAQIIPTRTEQTTAKVRAYNAKIPALVEQRAASGKHLLLVDMHGKFTVNPNYTSQYMHDDLHPNQAGFSVMGQTWYQAIQTLLH